MALDAFGGPVPDARIVWGSRSPQIVQAFGDGTVLARDYGEALVIASVGEASDTALARIVQVPETISIVAPDTIWPGVSEGRMPVTIIDSAGAPIADPPQWSTSDSSIAYAYSSVSHLAVLRAPGGTGPVTLTATLRGVSASIHLVVAQHATYLWVRSPESIRNVGDTMTVLATLRDAASREIPDIEVEWSSSDTAVAEVASTGLVTAVGGGTAVITARSGSFSGWEGVTVAHATPPEGALVVSPKARTSDGWGERIRLSAYVVDAAGDSVSVPATWTSRNEYMATVSEYFATTHRSGTTWLVAHYGGQSDSMSLHVDREPVAIDFQYPTDSIAIDLSYGASHRPVTVDRFGGIATPTPKWTIRDSTVVTAGNGIGGLKKGATWVVVEMDGLTDSLHVTVIPRRWGDYTIASPEDIDRLARTGVEELRGALRIESTSLTDLDGLESLRILRFGPVFIRNNAQLRDMSGLRNVEILDASLFVENNPNLTVALPALRAAGSLAIFNNGSIDASGFAALDSVGHELDFADVGPPLSFESLRYTGSFMIRDRGPREVRFPALERVRNDITLLNAAGLERFEAPLLWRARSVAISGNPSLEHLELPSLSTLLRDLSIERNAALADLSAFRVLTSSLRRLLIEENPSLVDATGLRQLGDALGSDPIVVEECRIRGNPGLGDRVEELVDHLDAKFPGQAVPVDPVTLARC